MFTRTHILLYMTSISTLGLLAYVFVPILAPTAEPDARIPLRRCGDSVIRLPERVPSAGLAWSERAYPGNFNPANRKRVEFAGLDDAENERFLDIGGRAYSREFISRFSYTDPALAPKVRLEYLGQAEAFTGRIIGEGLKPNFAYQVKLRGFFSDQPAFERIGLVGRWRLPGRGTNYTDADYRKFKDKHLVESYLLFDYFVTNGAGKVDKPFYADSSLHVLWSATTQRQPRPSDACARVVERETPHRASYAHPRVDLSPVRLFAESEEHSRSPRNRLPVCEAFLPAGSYTAEVVLTEESFHGFGDSGFWATVMSAPVAFEILDQPRPPAPEWKSLTEGAPLSLAAATVAQAKPEAQSDALLHGKSQGKKRPEISFTETLDWPEARAVLSLEMYCDGRDSWSFYFDAEDLQKAKPAWSIESMGRRGWQRFEVEVTSHRDAKHLAIVPCTKGGRFGVRNVRLCVVAE